MGTGQLPLCSTFHKGRDLRVCLMTIKGHGILNILLGVNKFMRFTPSLAVKERHQFYPSTNVIAYVLQFQQLRLVHIQAGMQYGLLLLGVTW